MSRSLALLLITALVLSSLVMVGSALAQSIPKPSVPEFKLSYTNHVYDVPAATSEWSGEPIPGTAYHVDYREVIVKIKNQPLDADVNGVRMQLYYNVRVKNHFSIDWTELFGRCLIAQGNDSVPGTLYYGASDSEVTYISISLNGPTNIIHASIDDVAVGNPVDFQVKALIGYMQNWTFSGEESTWSETQTLTIEESQTPSPSHGLTPTPEPNLHHQIKCFLGYLLLIYF